MSKISIEIGNKIRQFRQSRKMTLDELAPAIHKSRTTLSKYERGEISIDIIPIAVQRGFCRARILLIVQKSCFRLSNRTAFF